MRVRVGALSLFFEVLGQEWVLEEQGLRRRPVLLGLHGGPGEDGAMLRHRLAPMADVAQVVVPDQRGHGRSDYSTPACWNLETWAADVKALCDALEIERPVVLGVSFGGAVAQKYASHYPDHPGGLILVSTSARLASVDELAARFREVGGAEAGDVARRDLEDSSEETMAEWNRVCQPLLSRSREPDPLLARLEPARIKTPEVNLHFWSGEVQTLDLRPDLANVRCPTLVIAGEHDPLTPVHLVEELVAAIPDGLARLKLIEDAAHTVFQDNPEQVYRSLREFVADLGTMNV